MGQEGKLMNITPEQIPDEVVDAALFCTPINEYGEDMEMPIDAMGLGSQQGLPRARLIMKSALAAALPVLLGEPAAWMATSKPSSDGTVAIQFTHNPDYANECRRADWTVTPLYTLPTPESP